jgi:hypothetical protein
VCGLFEADELAGLWLQAFGDQVNLLILRVCCFCASSGVLCVCARERAQACMHGCGHMLCLHV